MLQETMRPPTAEEREVLEKRIAELEAPSGQVARQIRRLAVVSLVGIVSYYMSFYAASREDWGWLVILAIPGILVVCASVPLAIIIASELVSVVARRRKAVREQLPRLHECYSSGLVNVLTVEAESLIAIYFDLIAVCLFDVGENRTLIASDWDLYSEDHEHFRSRFIVVRTTGKEFLLGIFAAEGELIPIREVFDHEILASVDYPLPFVVMNGTPSEVLASWLKETSAHVA